MIPQKKRVSRRDFLRLLGAAGAGMALTACGVKNLPATNAQVTEEGQAFQPQVQQGEGGNMQPSATPEPSPIPTSTPKGADAYLSVVRGLDIAAMTAAAVAAVGGMEHFVKAGDEVVIKPNICTDYYSYEYGATTNPEVVAALVRLALGAGAKRVRVMDQPFGGSPKSAYERSGIAAAVSAAGGEMEVMNPNKFERVQIPNYLDIREWDFYRSVLDANVVINVPIAKHHGTTGLSLGCKNMMGVITNPGRIHSNIHKRIADLTSLVRPELTVVDAIRTLMANGPTGGNLNDVKMTNTILASHDIVAADTFAASFFGQTPDSIQYIRNAESLGLGTTDLNAIKIEEISL